MEKKKKKENRKWKEGRKEGKEREKVREKTCIFMVMVWKHQERTVSPKYYTIQAAELGRRQLCLRPGTLLSLQTTVSSQREKKIQN